MFTRIPTAALTLAALFIAGTASASCEHREQQLMSRLQASLASSPQDSICGTARHMIPLLREGLDYYSSCPIADPTGQMSAWLRESLSAARETERSVCTN